MSKLIAEFERQFFERNNVASEDSCMSEQILSIDTLEDCRAAREAARHLSGSARDYILGQIVEVEAKLTAEIMAKRKPVVGSRVLYRVDQRPISARMGGPPMPEYMGDFAAIVTGVPVSYEIGDSTHLTVFPPGGQPFCEVVCQDQTGKIPGTWRW